MRLFPALALLVLNTSIFTLIHAEVSIASNLSDADMKKNQMKQIETDLSREKEQFLKFGQKEKSLLDQLSGIEKDISEKRVILKELREKLRLSRVELKRRKERLNRLEDSLIEIEDLLGKRLSAFYKYAKRGYLQILTNTSGLDQLNHRMKYLRVILDEDRKIMRQMFDEQQNYKREVTLIEEQLSAIASLEEAESSRLLSLKEGLEKKVIFLAKIHKEKEFYETAVKELQSAAQNLKETLMNLERGQYKRKQLPKSFAMSKGKLPLPFKGKILKKSRKLGPEIFDNHKGIYIEGPFGAEVKAVFPGRVDFSGQLRGYGQVVVINHGSRFFTISAYLLHRDKAEGEMVSSGEIIGQVGETGLLAGSALYFEIREGETNLDPLKWLKVD
ncbi:MAG: peptidoglycan DD-metalloendopeptidase family protein [Deltaproteobacteria bacterium]|nr:peptidoglycan DD-metalloendopeptidase family protein [Deltaproteobacteria bacterium]